MPRVADRRSDGSRLKVPPRAIRCEFSTTGVESNASLWVRLDSDAASRASWHHSFTFPSVSKSPKSLGFRLPTGHVRFREFLRQISYLATNGMPTPKYRLVT